MNILTSIGQKRLEGHKDLTAHKEPVRFDPNSVYICAVDRKGAALKSSLGVGTAVKCGTRLGIRPDYDLPVISSVSGSIEAIEKIFNPALGRPTDYFVISNDKKYDVVVSEPLKAEPSISEVVESLKDAGLVGMGGGGFPTYLKYSTTSKIDHIIINDVECEPYLTCDFAATLIDIDKAIYAAKILVKALGAVDAVIAIKKDKIKLIEHIKEKIKDETNVRLELVRDVYPAGYERSLVKAIFNKSYKEYPYECGILVNNIQTLSAAGRFLKDGIKPSRRIYTFAGDGLNVSANVIAPVGTLIKDIIQFIGGYDEHAESIMLVLGGPMMGKSIRQENVSLDLSDSGVVVYNAVKLEKTFRLQPCLRCGACVDTCPVFLQPVLIRDALIRQDYSSANLLGILSCLECGLCSAVCPSHIDLALSFGQGKMLTKLKAPAKKKEDK